ESSRGEFFAQRNRRKRHADMRLVVVEVHRRERTVRQPIRPTKGQRAPPRRFHVQQSALFQDALDFGEYAPLLYDMFYDVGKKRAVKGLVREGEFVAFDVAGK